MTSEEKNFYHVNHERSWDIIVVSKGDKWFAYYWWYDIDHAPNFARQVDIHRKPGFDPLELFFNSQTKSIPFDTSLIKGSHGRPYNPETLEGYSLYVSNIDSDIQKDSDNSINAISIGKHLIDSI
jgi:hypothetical protein